MWNVLTKENTILIVHWVEVNEAGNYTLFSKENIDFHQWISTFTEAQAYISLLQTDGVNNPVDTEVDSNTMQLPEWFDPILFKR